MHQMKSATCRIIDDSIKLPPFVAQSDLQAQGSNSHNEIIIDDSFPQFMHDQLPDVVTEVKDESFVDGRIKKKPRTHFVLTTQQCAIAKLMKLLDDMNCPDYAFPKLLEWAIENESKNVSLASSSRKRDANIRWMRNMLHNANALLPEIVGAKLSPSMCQWMLLGSILFHNFCRHYKILTRWFKKIW